MRATTKTFTLRGNEYSVSVRPAPNTDAYKVTVNGTSVGWVTQYPNKTFRFESLDGRRIYHSGMLRQILADEAWRVQSEAEFAAEVENYTGPLDVTFDTTECVDCGQQVLKSTPEVPVGYDTCSGATGHYRGHRVSTEVYRAWQHQKQVIAAQIAAQAMCGARCVSEKRRTVAVCGVIGFHTTHVSTDDLTTWSDGIVATQEV